VNTTFLVANNQDQRASNARTRGGTHTAARAMNIFAPVFRASLLVP
jgi:hypothetical protein